MRRHIYLAASVAVVMLGVVAFAKSTVLPTPELSFAERWAPVDAAIDAGLFADGHSRPAQDAS